MKPGGAKGDELEQGSCHTKARYTSKGAHIRNLDLRMRAYGCRRSENLFFTKLFLPNCFFGRRQAAGKITLFVQ